MANLGFHTASLHGYRHFAAEALHGNEPREIRENSHY